MANIEQTRKRMQEVSQFYEAFGSHFARTRFSLWPWMKEVASRVLPGMTVVDVGAGNARFVEAFGEGVHYFGIEPSDELRRAGQSRLRTGDRLEKGMLPSLAVSDSVADLTTCIAVLHHVPRVLHRACFEELLRITKPGGLICISVWNARGRGFLRYPRAWVSAWLRMPLWKGLLPGEVYVPWKSQSEEAHRYVYAWTKNELEALAKEFGEVEQCEYYADEPSDVFNGKNILLIMKKVRDRSIEKTSFYG